MSCCARRYKLVRVLFTSKHSRMSRSKAWTRNSNACRKKLRPILNRGASDTVPTFLLTDPTSRARLDRIAKGKVTGTNLATKKLGMFIHFDGKRKGGATTAGIQARWCA